MAADKAGRPRIPMFEWEVSPRKHSSRPISCDLEQSPLKKQTGTSEETLTIQAKGKKQYTKIAHEW